MARTQKLKLIVLRSINSQKEAKRQRTSSQDKFKSMDKANLARRRKRTTRKQARAVSKAAKKKDIAAQPVRKKLKHKEKSTPTKPCRENHRATITCHATVVAGACKTASVLKRAKMPPSQRHLNQKFFVRFLLDLSNLTYKHGGIQKICPTTANRWGGQRA